MKKKKQNKNLEGKITDFEHAQSECDHKESIAEDMMQFRKLLIKLIIGKMEIPNMVTDLVQSEQAMENPGVDLFDDSQWEMLRDLSSQHEQACQQLREQAADLLSMFDQILATTFISDQYVCEITRDADYENLMSELDEVPDMEVTQDLGLSDEEIQEQDILDPDEDENFSESESEEEEFLEHLVFDKDSDECDSIMQEAAKRKDVVL